MKLSRLEAMGKLVEHKLLQYVRFFIIFFIDFYVAVELTLFVFTVLKTLNFFTEPLSLELGPVSWAVFVSISSNPPPTTSISLKEVNTLVSSTAIHRPTHSIHQNTSITIYAKCTQIQKLYTISVDKPVLNKEENIVAQKRELILN